MYCRSCGQEHDELGKFCRNCGASLDQGRPFETQTVDHTNSPENNTHISNAKQETEKSAITEEPQKDNVTQGSSKQNRKRLILPGAIAIILLLTGGYFFFGNSSTSPEQLLEDFEAAIKEENTEELASILTIESEEFEITEENLDGFIDLYSKAGTRQSLMSHLNSQIEFEGGYGIFPVDLIQDGNEYQLQVTPVYFNVYANYPNTDIFVNGELAVTSDTEDFEAEIGPYLPGEYTFTGAYNSHGFELEVEETSTGEDPSFPGSVFLYIEGDSVSFELYQNNYSDMDAITLLLNGEETGFDLTEESFVRPVVTDGSLNASFKADMPWGELITNEIPVDDTFIEVNLGDNDKLMDLMKDIIFIFNEEFNEAIATMDPSVFTTVNHDAAQYFAFEAEMLMEEDIVFHGAFHGVDFDDSSFVLTYTYDDLWVYSVDTIVYSEEALFLDGEEEPEMEQLENPFTYEIVYDEQSGSWFVLDWLEHYNTFDEEDVDRHRMEDPVYHKSTWADE